MLKVMQALSDVQGKLNAPKDKNNSFGKYKYRNAEGIIAAFKDLKVDGATLTMSDTVGVVGSQIFLTATATFTADGEQVQVTGCAMHALEKKGMDSAQITGAASSYARKYALCGLFAIDDSEHDPDGKDNNQSLNSKPVDHTPKRDDLIKALTDQAELAHLEDVWGNPNFNAVSAGLPEPMQLEVKAAYDKRKGELS